MSSTAEALVAVLQHVLRSINDLGRVELVSRGRKYKYVNDQFRRMRVENKHLVVDPENLTTNSAISSAYQILHSIDDGLLLEQFPQLCLVILAVARDLEANRWFDDGTGLITHLCDARMDLAPYKEMAVEYASSISDHHSSVGFDIMAYAKLNFLFTDHQIGMKLNDPDLIELVDTHFGSEALDSALVLEALKCFVHWGHTKAILSKLGVPNVLLSAETLAAFELFPPVNTQLKARVFTRFPSGTSRYSLLQKSMQLLRFWPFAKLIPFPTVNETTSPDWLVVLCKDIQADPVKYHLRAESKKLSGTPVNLRDLQTQTGPQTSFWLSFVALIFDWFDVPGSAPVKNDSRLPIVDSNLYAYLNEVLGEEYCEELESIKEKIISYEEKDWDASDIVNRLEGGVSLFDALSPFEAFDSSEI